MKKNSPDNYESIEIILSKDKTPIAYQKKVAELVNCGMTKAEAENFVSTTPIEMEFYYSDNLGLFMVESEAVDNAEIVDPYTGKLMEEYED